MKAVIGLGNPGKAYAKTRHNVGFMVLDRLVQTQGLSFKTEKKIKAETAKTPNALYIKPQTFMNLSGQAVAPLLQYYNIAPEDVLVVYDDLDLPPYHGRLRSHGGAGGHKGMLSLKEHCGDHPMKRLRIGIGHPQGTLPVSDYVLKKFPKRDQALLDQALDKAQKAILSWLEGDTFENVMTHYHTP